MCGVCGVVWGMGQVCGVGAAKHATNSPCSIHTRSVHMHLFSTHMINARVQIAQGPHKRPRDGAHSNKPLSKEEAEALARREAARRRVEARTKAQFGMS